MGRTHFSFRRHIVSLCLNVMTLFSWILFLCTKNHTPSKRSDFANRQNCSKGGDLCDRCLDRDHENLDCHHLPPYTIEESKICTIQGTNNEHGSPPIEISVTVENEEDPQRATIKMHIVGRNIDLTISSKLRYARQIPISPPPSLGPDITPFLRIPFPANASRPWQAICPPPSVPSLPSNSLGLIGPPTVVRRPPDIPGVLPPAPFPGPPESPKLILPSGAATAYSLVIRQQPERACCFSSDDERRPIDPPPVVELLKTKGPISAAELQTLLLRCTLWNNSCTQRRDIMGNTTSNSSGRESPQIRHEGECSSILQGNIFASANFLKDKNGRVRCFFIFPDLFIGFPDNYRLKFDLVDIGLPRSVATVHVSAEGISDEFVAYPRKKFPGMMQSTELTREISRQGFSIRVQGCDVTNRNVGRITHFQIESTIMTIKKFGTIEH